MKRSSVRRRMILAAAAMLATVPVSSCSVGQSDPPSITASVPAEVSEVRRSKGLYAGAIFDERQQIDVSATVEALRRVGANRYYYLIWDRRHPGEPPVSDGSSISNSEWSALPKFAAAAESAGIDVVVYLVPPTESSQGTYKPFQWDYLAWARAVHSLAKTHSNIVGMAIDDFAANTDMRLAEGRFQYTPEYTGRIRDALQHGGSNLKLYAVLYGQDYVGRTAVLSRFRNAIDGVIYPFAGPGQLHHAPQNTTDPNGVETTTRRVRAITGCETRDACWQFEVQAPNSTRVHPQFIAGSFEVPATTGARSLTFTMVDTRLTDGLDQYSLRVLVDGKQAQHTSRDFGHKKVVTVPFVGQKGKSSSISIRLEAPSVTRSVTATFSDFKVDGSPSEAATTEPVFESSDRSAGSVVKPLELVLMVYAARFGREATSATAADQSYLQQVLAPTVPLWADQQIDGLVVYRLNLTGVRESRLIGDPQSFPVVERVFSLLH